MRHNKEQQQQQLKSSTVINSSSTNLLHTIEDNSTTLPSTITLGSTISVGSGSGSNNEQLTEKTENLETVRPSQIPIKNVYRIKKELPMAYLGDTQKKKNTAVMIKHGISNVLQNGDQYSSDTYEDENEDDYDDDDDDPKDEKETVRYTTITKLDRKTSIPKSSSSESSTPNHIESDKLDNGGGSTSSLDDDDEDDEDGHDHEDTNNLAMNEFEKFKKEIHDEILSKEHLLDSYCETATIKDPDNIKSSIYELDKKKKIDPKKKVKLLAALKAIDCNESFDS